MGRKKKDAETVVETVTTETKENRIKTELCVIAHQNFCREQRKRRKARAMFRKAINTFLSVVVAFVIGIMLLYVLFLYFFGI